MGGGILTTQTAHLNWLRCAAKTFYQNRQK